MKVLVAGDRGYIGAVMVPFLRTAGHEIDGLDLGLYEGCDLGPGPEDIGSRPQRDMRDAQAGQLAGYDAVVCLAALSNDPLGDLNPAATCSVNLDGTLRLARAAKQAGVERLVFASSCELLSEGVLDHMLRRQNSTKPSGGDVPARDVSPPVAGPPQ
jgi:nucleoside-diphosphate-sugar epimerase